ncbi:hypothetical protein [Streptomyces sp. NPDC000618]|uniref:hypothetical protein n=1 Tax=Streptomyces sp. NPDC000618 TaxID=3154265 RepID=UPI00332B047E
MRRPEGCSVIGRCGILTGRRSGEVGAGIRLAPHATRVLRRPDLLDAVAARAAHPAHVSFRSWSYLQLHRADPHQVLAAVLRPTPPGNRLMPRARTWTQ